MHGLFRLVMMIDSKQHCLSPTEAYEYRPEAAVYDMHNPDNYCYCPVSEQCRKEKEDVDEWDMTECWETCKDGMIM